MSDQWLYRIHGQEFGPVSLELVRSLVESGAIAPDDDVRNADRSNWILACAATELRTSIKVSTSLSVERRSGRDEWYCRGTAGDYGPLSTIDLIQLAVNGELGPEEEIRSHADESWRQVRSIHRLLELLPFTEQKDNALTQSSYPNLVSDPLVATTILKPSPESSQERGSSPAESILCISHYGRRTHPERQDLDGAVPFVAADGSIRERPDVIHFPGVKPSEQGVSLSKSRMTDASSIDFIVNALGGFGLPPSFEGVDSISYRDQSSIHHGVSEALWSGWASGKEFTSIAFSELLSWAVTGRLLPTDFVRRGDEGQYVPAVNIAALFTVRAAANSLCHRTAHSTLDTCSSIGLKSSPEVSVKRSETSAATETSLNLPAANFDVMAQPKSPTHRFHCRESNMSSIGIRLVFGIALVLVVWVAGW